jgi:hypothetical protein
MSRARYTLGIAITTNTRSKANYVLYKSLEIRSRKTVEACKTAIEEIEKMVSKMEAKK